MITQEPINATDDGLATTLTTAHHYSGNIVDPKRGQKEMGVVEYRNRQYRDGQGLYLFDSENFHKGGIDGLSRTLKAGNNNSAVCHDFSIRRLTERECFRLMGVAENDIDKIQASGVSGSQQYKMAGNSIVVDVLYHIFRKMFVETGNEDRQGSLF